MLVGKTLFDKDYAKLVDDSLENSDAKEVLKVREEYRSILQDFTEETEKEKAEVMALGGLRIIGTERHESRRIDNQLRGRAGRQGDPGSSVFYISADDDLSRVFGSERLKRMAEIFKLDADTSINWKFFSRSVESAQRRVEGNNYSIRKSVVEYDNVLNRQREEVYAERNKILNGEDMHEKIVSMKISANIKSFDDENESRAIYDETTDKQHAILQNYCFLYFKGTGEDATLLTSFDLAPGDFNKSYELKLPLQKDSSFYENAVKLIDSNSIDIDMLLNSLILNNIASINKTLQFND